MRPRIRGLCTAVATLLCASGVMATMPSEAAKSLRLAHHHRPRHIADRTRASEFSTAPAGFIARIDAQNAQGGVNGHKLVPLVVDDQTTAAISAVQDANLEGSLRHRLGLPPLLLHGQVSQQQGIPVTGASTGPMG